MNFFLDQANFLFYNPKLENKNYSQEFKRVMKSVATQKGTGMHWMQKYENV